MLYEYAFIIIDLIVTVFRGGKIERFKGRVFNDLGQSRAVKLVLFIYLHADAPKMVLT